MTSNKSNNNNKFQLSLDLPSSSLTAGTNIPPPPPSPPPPQTLPAPATATKRKAHAPLKTAYSSSHLRDTAGAPPSPSPIDSPNPLRSHPTSSHSLARKFSGSPLVNPDAPLPPTGTSEEYKGGETLAQKRSNTPISHMAGSGSPPPKRPLSVRKLLSLKALNSAFSRSSLDGRDKSNEQGMEGMQGYMNGEGKKSSDNLSMFSFARSDTGTSVSNKSLRKRRSSAFWGRRGSNFFGGVVEEEGTETTDPERKKTPPPMIPEVRTLGKDYKEKDGAILGDGDIFKDIR